MKTLHLSFLSILLVFSQQTLAVPSYARNLKVSCTQCHSAFPMLNKYGRKFKENLGAKLKQEYADAFQSMNSNPLSARIKLRPYDKTTDNTQPSQRSFHEVELFITGRTAKMFYMVEMEAEDETPRADGFGLGSYFSTAYVGYQVNNSFNILTGMANPLANDSLGTVHHHNTMRGQWAASTFLPQKSQFIGFSGSKGKLRYLASFYGEQFEEGNVSPNGPEGKNPRNMVGRLSYELMNQNIGVTYANENGGDMKRFSIDGLFEFDDLTARAIYASTDLKTGLSTRDKNHVFSLETYYLFGNFTPMLGIDNYTQTNGADTYTNGQFALFYDLEENIRLNVNYETKLSVAKNEAKSGRFTVRGEVAF